MTNLFRAGHIGALIVLLAGCDGDPDTTEQPPPPDAQIVDGDAPDPDGNPPDLAVDLGVDPGDPDAGEEIDVEIDGSTEPMACDPALVIEPGEAYTAAYDLVVLTASGGTGNYRFELVENNSDGIVNTLSGAYLAGGIERVDDRVRVTDTGCIGEAFATVHVTEPLQIRPSVVAVAPRQALEFDVVGGSGQGEYRLSINNTQAMMTSEGAYAAGPRLGRDVIVVRDPLTGLEAEAVVSVVEDPTLTADPGRLFLPLGASMQVDFIGGSGWFDIDRNGRSAQYDPATRTFTAVEAGRTVFTLDDQYTPQQITIAVEVADPLEAPLVRAGRGFTQGTILGAGDLDNDGYPDAIVAHPEPSIDAFGDGAVFVYRGGPQGLRVDPTQVLAGVARDDRFGWAAVTADVDRDGRLDLVVGAPLNDTAGSNAGAVYIHRGLEDGTFEAEAAQVLTGQANNDQFGSAIAACDFNGDTFVDLAIGAPNYDHNASPYAQADQGAVFVFLGSEVGFTASADGGIAPGGTVNEAGDFVGVRTHHLGSALAAGDLDGDGLCDLAAGSQAGSGAVLVYRGQPPNPQMGLDEDGGINEVPSRIYVGSPANGFARTLAIGDINADSRADLVVAEHNADGGANNAGAVHVFSGGPIAGTARQELTIADAQFTWSGGVANRLAGFGLTVGDQTSDGIPDLIIGSRFDESGLEGEPIDVGSIVVVPGRARQWPSPDVSTTMYGEVSGQGVGSTVGVLGDVDGDGAIDLGTIAFGDSSLGINVGRPMFVSGATGRLRPVDLPGAAAGGQNGAAVAVPGDVDRDGLSDLLVGAPASPRQPDQLNAGAAYLYRGVDEGYASEPAIVFGGHPGHSTNDQFGFEVTGGDFDGDGNPDIFISAQQEQRPNPLDAETFAVDGQCPRAGNQGAVYIWRGGPDPIDPTRPDYIYYGAGGNARMAHMVTADINGDGREDLIVGGTNYNGFEVIYGRSPNPDGLIRVMCDPGITYRPQTGGTNIGQAFARLGDLNVDGCQDIAIGAWRDDFDIFVGEVEAPNRTGTVRVVFGWGGDGCPERPQTIVFGGEVANGEFAASVAAGNIIGGAELDLVVGAPNTTNANNIRTGAVFVIDGAYIQSLPTNDLEQLIPNVYPIAPEGTERAELYGVANGEDFGQVVRVIGSRIFVSRLRRPLGDIGPVGGAEVYGFYQSGLAYRIASFAGETWRPGGLMGQALAPDRTRPYLSIGGSQASGLATEAGAVYHYNLSGLR